MLASWAVRRRLTIEPGTEPEEPRRAASQAGPPDIRFATTCDATKWFGRASRPTVFTWALHDHVGTQTAVSAWAFPAILMAERDARTIQEFVDQLMLHIVSDAHTGGVAWFGERAGLPVLFSPEPYSNREDALQAATVAVGLLPVATVAAHAVNVDT